MAAKPNTRNWSDVQIMLLSISLVISLGLWNLFAKADIEKYTGNAQSSATESPIAALDILTPTPPQDVFILLGGAAPGTPTPQPVAQTGSGSTKSGGGKVKPPAGGGGGGGGTGGS